MHAWKGTTEISGYTYIYKEEQTGSPTVIVDREVFCEIVLQKYLAGDLEVFVIDEHNNPIPGATVILNPATFKPSNLELKNSSRKTERTGEAVFLKLPYGDYTVEAVHKEGSARSAQKTTRIFKPGMHPRVTIMIDFTKPETKRFSICIESASWVVGSSSQGPGVLLLSATFRVTELKSGRTARYEIRRAALAVFSLPLPIGGGNSTSEGNPVTFETLKYRQGSEMTAEDFATSVNVAYRSAGVGPVTIWPAEFDLEFLDIPNPSVKDKHMRSGGTFGWLKVPKLRPGEVRSSPGVEGGSAARVPFLKKSTQ